MSLLRVSDSPSFKCKQLPNGDFEAKGLSDVLLLIFSCITEDHENLAVTCHSFSLVLNKASEPLIDIFLDCCNKSNFLILNKASESLIGIFLDCCNKSKKLQFDKSNPSSLVLKKCLKNISNRKEMPIVGALVGLAELDQKENNLTILIVEDIKKRIFDIDSNGRKKVYGSLLRYWNGKKRIVGEILRSLSRREMDAWGKDMCSSLDRNSKCTDSVLEKVQRFWSCHSRVVSMEAKYNSLESKANSVSQLDAMLLFSTVNQVKKEMNDALSEIINSREAVR